MAFVNAFSVEGNPPIVFVDDGALLLSGFSLVHLRNILPWRACGAQSTDILQADGCENGKRQLKHIEPSEGLSIT